MIAAWAALKLAGGFLARNWRLVLCALAIAYVVSLYLRVDGLQADKRALTAQSNARGKALRLSIADTYRSDYRGLTAEAGSLARKAELDKRDAEDAVRTQRQHDALKAAKAYATAINADLQRALKALHTERPACVAALSVDLDAACD
jgi:hypothetical protein